MSKKSLLPFIILLLAATTVFAQQDSNSQNHRLRISLVTCGAGDEIWETFGHTAVRIVDSIKGTDMVYNYGTFNGYDKNFEIKFMRGKLPYYLSVYPFKEFMPEYVEGKRRVEEQVIALDDEHKHQIDSFLQWNAEPENNAYKYDFFFDNCATRIRDIFPKTFGADFVFGQAIPADSRLSYRNIINRYLYKKHWERTGINILLGSKIDKVMSNTDIMFLPDYLRDGVGGATIKGKKVAGPVITMLPGAAPTPAGLNQPLLVMCVIALLTILGLSINKLRVLGNIMSGIVLFVTGLLGLIILIMWFGTNHQGCSDNFNILWALPTNLILAIAKPKGRNRYSIIAILLIFVSLILHVLKVQELPLPELGPLLLALLFVFGTIYRRTRLKTP